MADVSVKMGVSGIAQFKQGMNEAQASVKTLDAALKANEKQFEKSGNAEEHYAAQTTLLNQKLKQQKEYIANAEKALKQMEDNGVSKNSVAYQKMQKNLIEATSAMMDTESQLQSLGSGAEKTAQKTDKLSGSLGGLNKKVSLEQVIGAIDRISGGLEKAGQKAIQLGEDIWNSVMDSARLADDIGTQAMILDMTPEMYQKYKGVFDTIGEITVSEWATAKRKVQKAINDPTQDQIDVLSALGIKTHETQQGKYGSVEKIAKDWETVFWEAASKLQRRVKYGQLTQDMADTWGEALFGKKFSSLKPLIELGKEGFYAALEEQTVASNEAIKKDAELNDAVIKLQNSYNALKMEVTSGLAPALTTATETLDSLLGKIMEYLETPEGQQAMKDLETAVSGLFEDLGKTDPESVVSGFVGVFNTVIGSLEWLVQHKDEVANALIGIVGAWGAMQIGSGILTIIKLIDGLRDLGVIGGGGAAATATGTAAGGGLSALVTSGLSKIVPGITSWVSVNGGPVFDWLTHESPIATLLNGQESTGEWWSRVTGEVNQNAETFSEDWENNNIVKFFESGIETIRQNVENTAKYWQEVNKVNQEAQEWVLPDEVTVEEAMAFVLEQTEPEVKVDLQAPEDSAEQIAEQVGEVIIPATLQISAITGGGEMGMGINGWPTGGGGGGRLMYIKEYANGLPLVPFDGYPAILHKGERVVPAREVGSSRNFSSNLYVESMYMNNGQDADGLAAAMAAAQRRTMSGYGS